MLQSTIEKILPQLPELCERFKIFLPIHRDAFFHDKEDGSGDVLVSIGEINYEGQYTFTFNVKGELLSVFSKTWRTDGSVRTEKISIGA